MVASLKHECFNFNRCLSASSLHLVALIAIYSFRYFIPNEHNILECSVTNVDKLTLCAMTNARYLFYFPKLQIGGTG